MKKAPSPSWCWKPRRIVWPSSWVICVSHRSTRCFSIVLVWSSPEKLGMLYEPLHAKRYVFLLGWLVASWWTPLNIRVTYRNLAPPETKWIISWRAEGRGSNSQLKDSDSSFPVREGWASGRCRSDSPSVLPPLVSSRAVAACPASQLAGRHSPGTEAARAAACISGDEAWLRPGFYLFCLVKKN